MARYYVSATRGSDSSGVGTATNPWKTIGKAIGPSPAITLSGSGDTLYIEPAVYREVVALGLTPTSSSPLTIAGDNDGAGFLLGGYTTPTTGTVDWRGWTDDLTPITTAEVLGAASKSWVTLQGLKILGSVPSSGTASCLNLTGSWSNWTIQDCIMVGTATKPYLCRLSATAGTALNLTVRRCDFVSSPGGFSVDLLAPFNTSEYGLNTLVQNCRFIGNNGGVRLSQVGGTGTLFATGVTVQSCSFFFLNGAAVSVSVSAGTTLTTPIAVSGCNMQLCTTGVSGTNTTQIAETGNILFCTSPRSNVTAGANSVTAASPAFDINDSRLQGSLTRLFGEPSVVSVMAAYGNYGTVPSVDMSNRARPEGYGLIKASSGAIERHATGVKNTTYQDTSSPACLALVGPSSQERSIDVEAQSTKLSIKVRWDGVHGDTNKPQVMLLANPEIGVAAQTLTATSTGGSGSTPNSYETLTFTDITPTATGVMTLRMISRSAADNGAAYFDTITLA